MRLAALKIGDHVEVNVRGRRFPAQVRSFPPHRQNAVRRIIGIEPLVPNTSERFVGARQVVRKLEAA